MTAAELTERLAEIHRRAFVTERAWQAAEFADLMNNRHVQIFDAAQGFALTRTVAGESELLTIAVAPTHQRQGIAAGVLQEWLATLEGTAETAFLEVAADNTGAIALYHVAGFEKVAVRRGYYHRGDSVAVDAWVMRRAITTGKAPDSLPYAPESS